MTSAPTGRIAAASVAGTLYGWARRTSTSFAELCDSGWTRQDSETVLADGLVYRLRMWPDLPPAMRTAPVLRLLSLMSNRPVNRRWIATHTQLASDAVDALLQRLVHQQAVEVIDTTRFAAKRLHDEDRGAVN